MRQEIASHREHFYNQRNVAPLNRDRIMVEDMDIEVSDEWFWNKPFPFQVDYSEKSANRVPSFLNASDGTMKRAKKYETMAQLIDKLKNGIISRREELNTKRYQIDQYAGYIATNKESISLLAEGNIKMERNFQLYQEMRFSSDNVMNCLNEKVGFD